MTESVRKLEMRGIRKEFPGVIANDGIDLTIEGGMILGLLGENGAGKSTLMNILYGLYQPDQGQILINDRPVHFRSPRDSIAHGIGMVHQHFMLVPTHTVIENLALAFPDTPFLAPTAPIRRRVEEFSSKYGMAIDLDAHVWELSAGQQQRVEILKALLSGADLLVLDEPTSVLTPSEAEELFTVLRRLISDGKSAIFITHKLDEILATSRRIVVLRHGKVAGSVETAETTKFDLARMMVGREIGFHHVRRSAQAVTPVLEVTGLVVPHAMGKTAVNGLSFTVHAHEILGVAGVSGNGQKELVEALTGLRKRHSGRVKVLGRDVAGSSPRSIFRAGVAHIPEERLKFGVVGSLPLTENGALRDYFRPPFSGRFFLDPPALRRRAEEIIAEYQVACPSPDSPIRLLSGGNIQKFLVGRELSGNPKVIIAAHPTYGVDIGAAELIRKRIIEARDGGAGVLLVSEDLDELFDVADRIAVMFKGEFRGVFSREAADRQRIGLLMAGSGTGG